MLNDVLWTFPIRDAHLSESFKFGICSPINWMKFREWISSSSLFDAQMLCVICDSCATLLLSCRRLLVGFLRTIPPFLLLFDTLWTFLYLGEYDRRKSLHPVCPFQQRTFASLWLPTLVGFHRLPAWNVRSLSIPPFFRCWTDFARARLGAVINKLSKAVDPG